MNMVKNYLILFIHHIIVSDLYPVCWTPQRSVFEVSNNLNIFIIFYCVALTNYLILDAFCVLYQHTVHW
jgi:hypothetical protein